MLRAFSLFFILFSSAVFAQDKSSNHQQADQKFILAAFNKADAYMNADHYDSAQVWLNKIYLKVSYQKPSLFSYYLTSRQAEVYYYNNLHQLGLQEAQKAEIIAKQLKDSLLLADAYNFLGLFNLNNNKLLAAEKCFKLGLKFVSQPPYKKAYIDLSKPHHIYGNLAEAFEKLKMPDSSVFYCRLSLQKAKEINAERGMATAALNLGLAYVLKHEIDSARKYFELTRDVAIKSADFDIELNGYGGIADCASILSNPHEAVASLEKGFALLNRKPQLNDFYSSMFLETAIKIYKKYKIEHLLVKTLELKSNLQTAVYSRNNIQIQTLLLMGLKNEKTIFNLELADTKSKQSLDRTRFYISALLLLLVVIGFLAYRYYSQQRIKLANMRSKISQDLHDEVGATLSGISMYSYITKEQIKNNEHELVGNSLDIIKNNASQMVAKLNDIVWAVNPIQDNLHALLDRLKEFMLQLTDAKAMQLLFLVPDDLQELKLSMEQRKNIYLICKEAINNAVKYSGGDLLQVKITFEHKNISIVIDDNRHGFVPDATSKGNGLLNMKNRAQEIKAKLTIDGRYGKGTRVSLICKIT